MHVYRGAIPSVGAGKWNKHIDAWDCLENQEFFSLEAFAFTLRQMFQVAKPPNRYTPEFMILKKYKDWEIRKCAPESLSYPAASWVQSPLSGALMELIACTLLQTSFSTWSARDNER